LSRSITGSPAKHPWQLYNTNTLDVSESSETSIGRTEIFHCCMIMLTPLAYLKGFTPHWSMSVAYMAAGISTIIQTKNA